jgi:hypothetical protein
MKALLIVTLIALLMLTSCSPAEAPAGAPAYCEQWGGRFAQPSKCTVD